jgi:NDP-sugar pyrophosphorylase family protein
MKTLFIIRNRDHAWISDYFSSVHPLLVTLCNKPYLEYLIDFSILAGSSALRVVSDNPLFEIENYCGEGTRWGIDITYASMQKDDDIQTVLEKNHRFCADSRIMIINGFLFISYNKTASYWESFDRLPDGELLGCGDGNIYLTGKDGSAANGSPSKNIPQLSITGIRCIDDYYRLSLEILGNKSDHYVIPGYRNEDHCHIGRNVVISKSAEIRKPVIIGNNVQLLAGSSIGPDAVIGSNVIIDKDSIISESMVLDNTYVGEHLELQGKIASGHKLIDPSSGTIVEMEDPHLMTGIGNTETKRHFPQSFVHGILAVILFTLLLIPYILFVPLLSLQGKTKKRKQTCFSGTKGKTLALTTTIIEQSGLAGRLAAAMSLDRFLMLPKVMYGQLALIGHHPFPVNEDSQQKVHGIQGYRPGVFSYAEAEDWPVIPADADIVESYHAVHGNPLQDIVMTVKAMLNRTYDKE